MTLSRKEAEQRQHDVLMALVRAYISTGSPVSSRAIVEEMGADLSSATIRNVLLDLDRLGLTEQPHSSSGRAPTTEAYRLHAHEVLSRKLPLKRLAGRLAGEFGDLSPVPGDVGSVLQRAAGVLARESGCAALVLSPRFENDFIREIKLVGIDPTRMLVVLVSDYGLIRSETVRTESRPSYFTLRRLEEYLNAKLRGQDEAIATYENGFTGEERQLGDELYRDIVLHYFINFAPGRASELFVEGFANLFEHEQLQSARSVSEAIRLFEQRDRFLRLLREAQGHDGAFVLFDQEIGGTLDVDLPLAMVTAPYRVNALSLGALAVVGPTRQPYERAVQLIRAMAGLLEGWLSEAWSRPRLGFDRDVPFKVTVGQMAQPQEQA
ncbi:MAG: heat-inducible transcription repressor HrcA [Verrucomicrobia bacterium]|nr:heat-inducible transcription repressor HrcA [Verrucomicrobiota bacterium]